MENLEVILVDFRKSELDKLVFDELRISFSQVKSSHFFDKNSGEDLEFHQINSLQDLLSPNGTGNIFLHQLEIGHNIKNVMIVFSFDEQYGDIVINFPESELFTGESALVKSNAKKAVEFIKGIKNKYNISKIRIGFEPASDDDTCLVELNEEADDVDKIVETLLK